MNLNNISKWKGEVLGTDDKPTKINFEHTLNENETYKLILDRQGKDISQTIMENGEIKVRQDPVVEMRDDLKDAIKEVKSMIAERAAEAGGGK